MTVAKNWWGEAPEQLYDFDEAAGLPRLDTWLHQYARRLVRRSLRLPISALIIRRGEVGATGHRVNKGLKRLIRPTHVVFSPTKPKEERHGRRTARHAFRSNVVLEFGHHYLR